MKTLATAFAMTLLATNAHARGHHHYHHHRHHYESIRYDGPAVGHGGANVAAARSRGLPWCGAYMADLLGLPHIYNGLNLWQASEWRHVGQPSAPHVGALVVWSHHVGKIVGQENGQWIVESGNDGHAIRRRARSIAGASVRSFS